MQYSKLCRLEVINLRDCTRLGTVQDMEFDECSGCIRKIFVSRGSRIESVFRLKEDLEIPFSEIRKIGDGLMFVDVCVKS